MWLRETDALYAIGLEWVRLDLWVNDLHFKFPGAPVND